MVITGEIGAQVLEPLLDELPGRVRLLPVKNAFFGGNIGVTGLLTGADIAAALEGQPEHDRYLLPDVALVARPVPRRHVRGRAAAHRRDRRRPTAPRLVRALQRHRAVTGEDSRSSRSSAVRTSASRRS